jgi:outer membrane receptor protein involved in Fe transport
MCRAIYCRNALFNPSVLQNVLHAIIRDSSNQQILAGVSCSLKGQKAAAVSDRNGLLILKNIPDGSQTISFSNVSFKPVELILSFPLSSDSPIVVLMVPEQKELEQVTIVASSRTNSRLENLPTRVEVIGEEDMIEENGIKPGNIASILGDIAGIQFQQTSATTGNADMRIQGLQGKYTQILRDGLPLFGGYSGSFGILQIPPLDLRQVEIIKGASSTLFGGGAIAGMINLISKDP